MIDKKIADRIIARRSGCVIMTVVLLVIAGYCPQGSAGSSDIAVSQVAVPAVPGSGVDLNMAVDDAGNRPIHLAVRDDNADMIRDLIGKGVDLNVKNNLEMTPLHFAKSSIAAELLLKGGADPEQENRAGDTLLHQVKQKGIASMLLENGARVDHRNSWQRTPLHNAAKSGYTEVVRLLLDRGAQINAVDKSGRAPVHMSDKRKLDLVTLLVTRGADLEIRGTAMGATVLHHAAETGTLEVVEYLISKKCDVKAFDKFGFTSLHFARTKEIAGKLLDHGADMGFKTQMGFTPVWTSLLGEGTHSFQRRGGGLDVMKFLVKRGASVLIRDNEGNCMLHFAVYFGADAVTYLLEKGLTPDIKNKRGKTPLDMARRHADPNIIQIMEKSQAK